MKTYCLALSLFCLTLQTVSAFPWLLNRGELESSECRFRECFDFSNLPQQLSLSANGTQFNSSLNAICRVMDSARSCFEDLQCEETGIITTVKAYLKFSEFLCDIGRPEFYARRSCWSSPNWYEGSFNCRRFFEVSGCSDMKFIYDCFIELTETECSIDASRFIWRMLRQGKSVYDAFYECGELGLSPMYTGNIFTKFYQYFML